MPGKPTRTTQILDSLDAQDVTGCSYPSDVTTPENRLRWNQARLVAIALYHTYEPTMRPDEHKQELYGMAVSIYRQSRTTFPTGTAEQLAEEIAAATARGWL